jgi:hypothetical protein
MMLVKVAERGEERGRPQLAAAYRSGKPDRARYLVAGVVARGEANPIPTAYDDGLRVQPGRRPDFTQAAISG